MSTTVHQNSHKVTIFRAVSFLQSSQGPDTQAYFAQSKEGIGSYFESLNSQTIGSGLTNKEKELLLPQIVDVDADDKEFRKKVRAFYCEIQTVVPVETGVTLEVGLESDNERPVAKDNLPINVLDYIRYKHAIGHPHVALTRDASKGNSTKRFYVFDKLAAQSKNSERNKQKDKAMIEYLKLKEDMDLVDQMLTLMGEDIRTFVGKSATSDKIDKLRDLVEGKPKEFLDAHEAGDLETRAWIQNMVNTDVLKKIGNKYIDSETQDVIGNTLEETIFFLDDEANSGVVTMLKARYQEARKMPVVTWSRRTQV